ncbi:MAG: hypothetical protein P8O93_07335 [Flavobacteriaceae bacterium]|nr:hypothetical protein [Flavobacteriaceae bacterium]MDG1962539.1 hypothetical protein [Flavobacteriaceae bacterium]
MYRFIWYLLPGLLFPLLTSCVKDTDFDQLQEVVITPEVDVNLLFFEINSNEFVDPVTGLPRMVLSDVTDIPFLDDSDTQEGIIRADFLYEFDNFTSIDYQVTISFRRGADNVTYSVDFIVPAGAVANPQSHIVLDQVEAPQIYDLTQANKMAVTVDPLGQLPAGGSLVMRSKATFYLLINGQ